MAISWATVVDALEVHKERLVPIATFTVIGSCVFVGCKLKTWFRSPQQDHNHGHRDKNKEVRIVELPPEVKNFS